MPAFYFYFQCPDGNACLRSIYLHLELKQQIYEFEFTPSLVEVQKFLAGVTSSLLLGKGYTLLNTAGIKGKMTLLHNKDKILLYGSVARNFLAYYCMIKYYGVMDLEGIRQDVRVVTAGFP